MNEGTSPQSPDNAEEVRDPVLGELLGKWDVPDISRALERQILSDYRKGLRHEPLWRRLFFTSVRVPIPIAAAALILLLLAAANAFRHPPETKTAPTAISRGAVQANNSDAPLVINTSLAGFHPVSDVNVTVIGDRLK